MFQVGFAQPTWTVWLSFPLSSKEYRDRQFFISSGTIDQILAAINEIDSVPYVTVLEFLIYNSFFISEVVWGWRFNLEDFIHYLWGSSIQKF